MVTPEELRRAASHELAELGDPPAGVHQQHLWLEERRGAAVLLAGLADWNASTVRRAMWLDPTDDDVRALLADALHECDASADPSHGSP